MTDPETIEQRLRAFEGSDALGNGDFSICTEAADLIASLRERLEIVPGESESVDGISCRDETIKLQDARIDRLEAAIVSLREALRSAIGAMETLDHPEDYGALKKARAALAAGEGGR